jgi:hypothetical protein
LTRICHTPAKKPYEFIRTLARITLSMQIDELIHPNRYKTHYATPFPIVKTDAWPATIHARFLPTLLFETIPGFLNPQPANRILAPAEVARTVNGALATFPEGVVPLHVGEPLHDPPLVNLEPNWQPGLDQIHHQLEAILLRRTRQEVLKDLPETTDQIFRVPLTEKHAEPLLGGKRHPRKVDAQVGGTGLAVGDRPAADHVLSANHAHALRLDLPFR